jgi:branched-subunit amino acid transport protein
MSTQLWLVVVATAAVTAFIKAFGPMTVGGRELPTWSAGIIGLLAPALLAALVVVSALTDGKSLAAGPQTVGVAAAGVALWRGANVLVAVVVAVVVTAGLRALGA